MGILREEELQELAVVIEAVKHLAQWSTEVENRMDVRSTPIGNTRSSSSPSVLVSSTD